PRRRRTHHRDDLRPLHLGQPPRPPRPRPITQPIHTISVKPVQPPAHRLLMTPQLIRDRRHRQPIPTRGHHLRPQLPPRRRLPRTSKPTNRTLLVAIAGRSHLTTSPYPRVTTQPGHIQ